MTIARGRWQEHLKTGGDYYHAKARELEALHASHPDVGADVAALAHHALAELLERCRVERLTRHQHVLLRLGALIAQVEGAAALARRAQRAADRDSTRRPRGACVPARSPRRAASTRAGPRWTVADGGRPLGGGSRRRPRRARAAPRPRCDPPAQGGLLADLDAVARPSTGGCGREGEGRMTDAFDSAAAIVGVGAILPDAPDAGVVLAQRHDRPLLDQRRRPRPVGPGALLRPGPEGAGEDLLEDRRLGPRLGVGSVRLEAAAAAEGERRDGRRPEVGGRLHADGARRTPAGRIVRSTSTGPR